MIALYRFKKRREDMNDPMLLAITRGRGLSSQLLMQLRRSQKRALATSAASADASAASDDAGSVPISSEEPLNEKKPRKCPAKKTKLSATKRTSKSIPIVPIVTSSASAASQFPLLSALKERRQGHRADDKILFTYEHLVPGRLLRRYKRFLADIELVDAQQEPCDSDDVAVINEANVVTVYCPNTGPMVGLLDLPNARVQLSKSDDPKRKYAYTLEMIQVDVSTVFSSSFYCGLIVG